MEGTQGPLCTVQALAASADVELGQTSRFTTCGDSHHCLNTLALTLVTALFLCFTLWWHSLHLCLLVCWGVWERCSLSCPSSPTPHCGPQGQPGTEAAAHPSVTPGGTGPHSPEANTPVDAKGALPEGYARSIVRWAKKSLALLLTWIYLKYERQSGVLTLAYGCHSWSENRNSLIHLFACLIVLCWIAVCIFLAKEING